ncbi:SIS domain-containing protein [Vibrio sp. S11_S32]|uniref:SIS domain-containing protein n=1 Tax=Vibrio sp. S11_S32 TaxID=2720225 RepID=UPI0016818E39|nr:SIS domain-containing protein [Vibrio sp. S11_S32]MBD1575753.1 SIS domain-containing protein [Vibrio sp. S11_S32]
MTQILGYSSEWLVERNGFHTANEIAHQPRLWQEIAQTISSKNNEIDAFLAPIFAKQDLRVILTGAGTSAFAGDAVAPYLNEKANFSVEAIATTEIVANPEKTLNAKQPTLVVSFARSGNSPESTAAVAIANQVVEECYHLILTCNPEGELAQYANTVSNAYSLLMPEGSNDKSFAMTSSFSCMTLSALALIGQVASDELVATSQEIATLCTAKLEQWQPLIKQLAAMDYERLIVLGSGGFAGLAKEASLKSLELSAGKVMTAFDSSLGFRHGPKFTINDKALVIQFISSKAYTRQYDLDLFNELNRDGLAAKVIGLSETPEENLSLLEVGEVTGDEIWLSFPYILFAQMLSFEKSLALGFGPDNPCPSGEVNRVVQGVTIYSYNK